MLLEGDYLFIAGNALYNRLNQSSKHLPFAFAPWVERLDVVGYRNFYGGPPASAWHRLIEGLRRVRHDVIRIEETDRLREIGVRKLHLPQPLEMTLQARWIEHVLFPHLRDRYAAAIICGPENCWLAERLLKTDRADWLFYYDTDHFPSYVARQWSAIAAHQESRLIALADGVVSVSEPLRTLRRAQGADTTFVINNGVNVDLFSQAAVERVSEPHPVTLIYTGTLDLRWGIDLAIRAMPLIVRHIPDARLIVVGDGKDELRLKALAERCTADKVVSFVGRVDYETLPQWMAQADFGVALSRPNAFRQYASPMKIADYLAAGLVVLCSGGGDGERLVRESGGGVCLSDRPEAIAEAVIALARDPLRMTTLSQRALSYAHTLTWERCGEKLAGFIADISGAATSVLPARERAPA